MSITKNYTDFLLEKILNPVYEADDSDEDDGAKELSDKQRKYQLLMKFGLAKFGAESPGSLSKEDKIKFFNWIKDNWNKDKGDYKNPDLEQKIQKAIDKGLIPETSPAEMSQEEYEKHQEEEAKKKKEQFNKIMNEE